MSKGKIVTLSLISIILIALIVGIVVFWSITNYSKLDDNKLRQEESGITILDTDGQKVPYGKSNYVAFNDISKNVTSAFVALEDKRFYKHDGIDYIRIAGAIINNIKSGSYKEGASTITQQLIKNTHLTSEKTIIRKLNEVKLASLLEQKYTKDEILEMYLNVIYFGSGIYGVGDATLAFYGKRPADVTISEAALLAGIVKNPRSYSPLLDYNSSISRRNVVLKVMLENEFISNIDYNTAVNEEIAIKNTLTENTSSKKYCAEAINQACTILGLTEKELVGSGYTIRTYMDSAAQRLLYERTISSELNPNNANNANIIIDNKTGGVKAYSSNLAVQVQSIRAIAGSTLKPFAVYAQALEQSLISPADKILDEPVTINGYSPSNYNNVYHGYVSIRDAIAHSYNVPALKVMDRIGVMSSVSMLNKFKFKVGETDENLSLALGSLTVDPLTMATAYSTLSRGGIHRNTSFISEIHNSKGKLLYRNTIDDEQIVSQSTAYLLTDMLKSAVTQGTCNKLSYLPYQIAAKSGTVAATDRMTRDAWCVAYTTQDTMLTWHGARDGSPLPQEYGGGGYPASTIQSVMREYYSESHPSNFVMPNTAAQYPIDKHEHMTNNSVYLGSDDSYTEIFSIFNPPELKQHDNNISTNNRPMLRTDMSSGAMRVLIDNLVIGGHYKIYIKSGIFARYQLIDDFIATSQTYVSAMNLHVPSGTFYRLKLLKDTLVVAMC